MNIGSILRQKRKELKLTLKAVAEKASISEGFLSQVENDVSSPSVDTLFKICAAMEIEAGDVLNLAKKQEGLILKYLKDSVAPYKVPKVIEFMDELPTSGVGKVLKRELKKKMT